MTIKLRYRIARAIISSMYASNEDSMCMGVLNDLLEEFIEDYPEYEDELHSIMEKYHKPKEFYSYIYNNYIYDLYQLLIKYDSEKDMDFLKVEGDN